MTVNQIPEGKKLTIVISGRLDTNSSPKLEAVLRQSVSGVTELVFDFSGVEYLSSAGLRVLLAAQKVMNRPGKHEADRGQRRCDGGFRNHGLFRYSDGGINHPMGPVAAIRGERTSTGRCMEDRTEETKDE